MKRDKFIITFNGQEIIAHSWNGARRSIEKIVREIARSEKQIYRLINEGSQKDEYGLNHVKGFRVWESEKGDSLRFDIQKESIK